MADRSKANMDLGSSSWVADLPDGTDSKNRTKPNSLSGPALQSRAMDQLQGMRVFARVAELGSFARAAQHARPVARHGHRATWPSSKNTSAPACSTAPRARCRYRRRARSISNTANASSPRSTRPTTSCAWRATARRGSCASTYRWPSASTCCCRRSRSSRSVTRHLARGALQRSLRGHRSPKAVDVAVRVGKVNSPGSHREAHRGVAPADLRVAEVPGARRHAAHARRSAQAPPHRPPARRILAARRTGSSNRATARARCTCRWRCRSIRSTR